ncbi:hypothetical protein MTO96_003402 [Rhipicephalus appendiculatus]
MASEADGDKLELVLKDSQLEHIPRSVFQKVKPSTLVLSNVTVRSYRAPDADASVFAELRDTLEKLVFHKNSSLPESWSLLKDNRRLSELLLFRMASLRLSQDFNELPASVRDVAVVQSTISGVDARWLSSLNNLESLRIDKVDLEKFERSMLPRPASKLKYLTIAGTDLSALPEDFAQDMPSLEKLNLRRNKFTTFQEAALAPFKSRNVIVELQGAKCWRLVSITVARGRRTRVADWPLSLDPTPKAISDDRGEVRASAERTQTTLSLRLEDA